MTKTRQTIVGMIAGAFALTAALAAAEESVLVKSGKTLTISGPHPPLKGAMQDASKIVALDDELIIDGKIGNGVQITATKITLQNSGLHERDIPVIPDIARVEREEGALIITSLLRHTKNISGNDVSFPVPIRIVVKKEPPAQIVQNTPRAP